MPDGRDGVGEGDAEERCPDPASIDARRTEARDPAAPGRGAVDRGGASSTKDVALPPVAPAWPPLVHVLDCDRSELLRRIVGG